MGKKDCNTLLDHKWVFSEDKSCLLGSRCCKLTLEVFFLNLCVETQETRTHLCVCSCSLKTKYFIIPVPQRMSHEITLNSPKKE